MPVESNPNTPFNEAVSQIFGRHPIYDEIFSCLTPLALVRMASSSRAIRSATEDFARRAYNINKRLKRYFNDPQSFRSLMARTDMVISGSFALQFFDRSFYPESDLDLYAYPNGKLHGIGSHLLKEGYTFKPVGEQIPDLSLEIEYTLLCGPRPHVEENDTNMHDVYDDAVNAIKGVLNFERPLEGTDGDARKVQVIVACESPIELILNFHSTCVMNVITHDTACALYPHATFERREMLVVNNPRNAEDALAKYVARGWQRLTHDHPSLRRSRAEPPNTTSFFAWIERKLSDSMAWTIALDTDGVALTSSPTLGSPSTSSHWSDLVARCYWTLRVYDAEASIQSDLRPPNRSQWVAPPRVRGYTAEYTTELWGDGGASGYSIDVLRRFRHINL